jgi:riboflavin biosynthesis pyrimidine reductase
LSSATVTHTTLALLPLEPLYETPRLPAFDLPEGLAVAYGGPLGFSEPRLYANFVASLDGVVALPGEIQSNRMISADSEADRFVMGLLRASADAVLVGAGTMRSAPRTQWTAEHAYPPAAPLFGELRRSRGRSPRPELAVLSGSGSVDPRHPALEEGAVVLTSGRGATRLRRRLPGAATILTVGAETPVDPAAAVEALRQRGHKLILSEGGPLAFGALVAAGLVDELFLRRRRYWPAARRAAHGRRWSSKPSSSRTRRSNASCSRSGAPDRNSSSATSCRGQRGERRDRHRRQCHLVGGVAIGARSHWYLRRRIWVQRRRELGPRPDRRASAPGAT